MVFAMTLAICSIQNQNKSYCALDKMKILFGDTVEFYVETRMGLICCSWKWGEPEIISWMFCLSQQRLHKKFMPKQEELWTPKNWDSRVSI